MFTFVSSPLAPVSLWVRGRRGHPIWPSHVETHFIFSPLRCAAPLRRQYEPAVLFDEGATSSNINNQGQSVCRTLYAPIQTFNQALNTTPSPLFTPTSPSKVRGAPPFCFSGGWDKRSSPICSPRRCGGGARWLAAHNTKVMQHCWPCALGITRCRVREAPQRTRSPTRFTLPTTAWCRVGEVSWITRCAAHMRSTQCPSPPTSPETRRVSSTPGSSMGLHASARRFTVPE
jgi:hypothetical protein